MKEKRRSRGGAKVFSSTKRIIILAILILLLGTIAFAKRMLKNQKDELSSKDEKIAQLELEIESESVKAEQLKKNDNQAMKDDDMEALARSELGLIKRNEIVIKPR